MNERWATNLEEIGIKTSNQYVASLVTHDSIVNDKGLGYVVMTMKENLPQGIGGKSMGLKYNVDTGEWICHLSGIEPANRMDEQSVPSFCRN